MKWVKSELGLECLAADWLLPEERVIRTGTDIVVIREQIVRAFVEDADDELDIRALVESHRG